MALKDLLALEQSRTGTLEVTQERLNACMPQIRSLIAQFRQYPDLFIDFIKGPDCNFKFYFYQRVFLRIVMRHRYVYATFPRAYSKSFLSMMALMLRCIFYPNSQLFITTGGKQQAASITIAKIDEICRLIPALQNEIIWDRGVSTKSKDDVTYVLIDQKALNEIVIPTTNVDRRLPDGSRHPDETVNQSQIYITTAGWKNSFAYQKLIQLLIQSAIDPDEVMVMGGTYQTPVVEGLLQKNFVESLKLNGTYNEDSFDRQYRSRWTGDAENAFFSSEKFDKHRELLQPEYEYSGRTSRSGYYVLGVDVGRIGCTTQVCVFKVTPQPNGSAIKSLVNIYTYDEQHFETQAIHIKTLYYKYKARAIALDANGLGVGLMDYMVQRQITPQGDELPPFGVDNDQDGIYRKFRTDDMERDAIFQIKANAPINTQAYSYAQTQMSSGKVKFLIDEQQARVKLMSTKVGQNMSQDKRNEYLQPFRMTSILRQQMLNLVESNEGVNIILKQSSKGIRKDKFSAFIYGLYYIKQQQDRKKKKGKRDLGRLQFFN